MFILLTAGSPFKNWSIRILRVIQPPDVIEADSKNVQKHEHRITPDMNQDEPPLLEQGIDEWGHGTRFRKNDQRTQKKKDDHNGQEPEFLAELEKFPEFGQQGLLRHIGLLKIV